MTTVVSNLRMTPVARLRDLRENRLHKHTAPDGTRVVLVRKDDEVFAWNATCPHQGADLSDGLLEDDHLECPMHGWRFHVKTGRQSDEGPTCLTSFPCRVEKGWILVALPGGVESDGVREVHQLKGPRGLPFLGKLVNIKKLHLVLEKWAEKYPDMFPVTIAGKSWLAVSNPHYISEMLKNRPESWRRVSSIEEVFSELDIDGVFSVEGETWKHHRKLVMPAFNNRHMQAYYLSLKKIAHDLRDVWTLRSKGGRPIEVVKDLMRFTVDVTSKLAFGYEMNTLAGGHDELQEHLEQIFPMVSLRSSLPLAYWRHVKLPMDYRLDRAMEKVKAIITAIIEKMRREMDLNKKPETLLEAMLQAEELGGEDGLTNKELMGNMLTILLAGEDTTANTLAWMMYYFSIYPDVQQRVREEVQSIVKDGDLTEFAQTRDMPYLDAVTRETMRMKAVVPLLFLEPVADTVLGDVRIPAGTPIFGLMRYAGLREAYVPEADVFNPDRWLPGNESLRPPEEVCFPFGGGPRLCPGRSLALLEIKLVMSMLTSTFEVLPPPGGKTPAEVFSFTMTPKNLRLNLKLL